MQPRHYRYRETSKSLLTLVGEAGEEEEDEEERMEVRRHPVVVEDVVEDEEELEHERVSTTMTLQRVGASTNHSRSCRCNVTSPTRSFQREHEAIAMLFYRG